MPISSLIGKLIPAATLLAIAGTMACGRGAEEAEQPDVLLITVDSLRADRPGFAGGQVRTPNMDRLAEGAVIFTSAYSPAPQTLPSLASLLTGLYPAAHGARLDGGSRLGEGIETLASLLKKQGYTTAAFPAARALHPKHGLALGFDTYREAFEDVPRLAVADTLGLPANQVADRALEWLEAAAPSQRIFLWVNFFDPHYFHTPPSPWKEQYEEVPYDGEVAQVDHEIGRLLDGLKEHGREGKTIVVLAGNHGEGLGDGGEQFYGILLRESTLRVPLVVRQPRAETISRRVADPVSLVDVTPTLLDLLGIPMARKMDGVSLAGLIREGGAPPPPRSLYFETLVPQHLFGWASLRGVRSGHLKYVEAPGTAWRALYDLDSDPNESEDLSAARAAEMEPLAAEARRIGGDLPGISTSLSGPVAEVVSSLGLRTAPRPTEQRLPTDNVDLGNAALQARRSLERGMARAAILLLQDVLASDPGNYSGLMGAAFIAVGMNQLPVAEKYLREAQALYPADGEIYHQLGHVILSANKGPRALSDARLLFETAATLAPLNEEALYDAACSVSRENQEMALGYLEGAVRNGYRDFAHMAVDPDMAPIRETARFKMITQGRAIPAPAPPPGTPAPVQGAPASSPGR